MRRVLVFALAALSASVFPAAAEVVTFDTSLVSPDTNPIGPNNLSWYNGSGNAGVQGGWTVATGNGIEIGLSAILRQVNAVIDSPDGTYYVPNGIQTQPPALSTNAARDAWNFQFSIDLNPGGNTPGYLTLNQVTSVLRITDLNTLATTSFDPTAIADDSGFATANGMTLLDRTTQGSRTGPTNLNGALLGTEWGAQNSQNPLFGGFPAILNYDMSAAHTYQFDLTVTRNSDNMLLANDTIDVVVTPEPSTFAMLAIGAVALLIVRRRRSLAA